MIRRILALMAVSIVLALSFTVCAPKLIPDGFIQLARTEVAFSTTRAVLPIPPASPAVKRLIILALVNDIDFTNIRVEFENGTSFEHSKRARISPDRDSILLDLPGERRKVREVIVQYRNVRQTARRAMVEIWGDPK
jgi:hypothetical protein